MNNPGIGARFPGAGKGYLAGAPIFLRVLLVFVSPYRQIPRQYPRQTKTSYFHTFSNSSFTNYSNIRRHLAREFANASKNWFSAKTTYFTEKERLGCGLQQQHYSEICLKSRIERNPVFIGKPSQPRGSSTPIASMTRNLPAKETKSLTIPLYPDFTQNGKFVAPKQINHDNAVLSHFPRIISTCISVLLQRRTSPLRYSFFNLYISIVNVE